MNLLVYATDDGTPNGAGPLLFLRERPDASLPANPRSLEWRYLATIVDDDALLAPDRGAAIEGIRGQGFYIAHRMI